MRRTASICVPTVVVLLGVCTGAGAQEAKVVSEQLWLDYNPRWTDRSHREIYGDVGLRKVLDADNWRFVIRPGVRGPVGSFRLSGGVGTFFDVRELTSNLLEIRPFQGISAVWPNRRVRFQHYLRLEQRLEWRTDDWTLDASLRGRYLLQVDYSFSGFSSGSDWRVLLHIEPFLTLAGNAGNFDEQVRLGVGAGRNVGSAVRVRADFTWEKVDFKEGASVSALFIRVRVYQGWLRGLTTEDG